MLMRLLAFVATIPVFILTLIDEIHFFQLNSYKPITQCGWWKKNPSKYTVNIGLGALAAFCPLIPNQAAGVVIFVGLMIIAAVLDVPKKAKKPLVYTPRVKRMISSACILYLLIWGAAEWFVPPFSTLTCAVLVALSPFWCLFANAVNRPMERHINNGYTKEAKDILKSCRFHLKVIGITGSYGKTSVKYFLTSLLQAKYNVLMTPENFNTPLGVVKTIRGSLRSTHEIFVCEMGARWKGDIKELCELVDPDDGIITAIGPQHLESFGSLDVVKSTKFELADALDEKGLLFLNADDENVCSVKHAHPAVTYGTGEGCDYRATDITVSHRGTSFTVVTKDGEKQEYTMHLLGRHNVLNVVGAIACANKMGITLQELKGSVRKLEGVEHRLQLTNRGNFTLIDDAYNANPSGTKAALETLNLFDGFKIIVTPGMVELGEKQEELNREFGKNIAEVCDFAVLVGQRQAPPIKQGLLDAQYDEKKIFVADTIQQALDFVQALSSDGKKKIVLLENDLPDNY